jgi:hypothetical protein
MMWHVVFAEPGALPKSRAARSRDSAIHLACELLHQSYDVRRVIEPSGAFIERQELDQHYDGGRFPGLQRRLRTELSIPRLEVDKSSNAVATPAMTDPHSPLRSWRKMRSVGYQGLFSRPLNQRQQLS